MDIGPIVRIPILPTTSEVPRIEATKLVRPVRSELPSLAVAEPPSSPPTEPDPRRPPPGDAVERRITIDPATQQVVFQAVDNESGEVVRQIPEEVMLRLQVYARALRQAAAGETPLAEKLA